MKRFALLLGVLGLMFGSASQAPAAFIPVGIQTNVTTNTILNTWGWSVLHSEPYGTFGTNVAGVLAGAQEYVMLAAINNANPNLVTLLAAAKTSDVSTVTAANATHLANGSWWYYNGLSMGFAPNSTISQNSADTTDAPGFGGDPNVGALRLSWHTGPLGTLNGGWRAGNTTFLNSEPSGWTRVIFTANATVPEPVSLALFGFAATAVGFLGVRRRKAAVAA